MRKIENLGFEPSEANQQLQGFEIRGSAEDLAAEYESAFDGIESAELSELFEEFRQILAEAPDAVIEEIEAGDISSIEKRAIDVWGWTKKKAQQFGLFALILSTAAPAFAGGKEEVLHHLKTVQPPSLAEFTRGETMHDDQKENNEEHHVHLGHFKDLKTVSMSKDVKVAPLSLQRNQMGRSDRSQYVGGVTINGQPGQVIYQDSERVVIGAPGVSQYEKRSDGSEVAVGVVVIE